MVTFAQAQERAERWINGGVPAYQHREVKVREFELGFVAWAEDRADGPRGDGGLARLVIARDSGESTLWPGLSVGEVIRRYLEEYGTRAEAAPEPAPPRRTDLEATSFLLSPPDWLQEAADRMGIPDRRGGERPTEPATAAPSQGGVAPPAPEPQRAPEPQVAQPPAEPARPVVSGWADTSDSGEGESIALPDTVFSPPLGSGDDEPGAGAAPEPPAPVAEPRTELMPEGSALPPTKLSPALERPAAPPEEGESIAYAATSKVKPTPRPSRGRGPTVPPPPGAPGVPGAGRKPQGAAGSGSSGGVAGGYVPTQMVSADDVAAQGGTGEPGPGTPPPPSGEGSSGGGVHHAATMLAGPQGGPGQGGQPPAPPAPPGHSGGDVHQAATMLAGPGPSGAGAPLPPQPPPGSPQPPPGVPQGQPGAPQGHPGGQAYGYPQQPGVPMVGPGYMAVLRYRAPDGSEQQLIRRSAPGMPHPEWQILYELRSMNVPPQEVLELHTELESCDLPGGYCARMVRETWPQVRVSHTAPYGTDHGSRQQGMRHLLTHQGELHQVADGPARPAPVRAPLQPVPQAAPIPPDGIGQELQQAFGPQGVFRFDQRAVSRQGVPDIVAQTLMWAGLPTEFGPFFWAQAQPGRPVPTLAELAQERGVQPGPDAGTYLVMGSDFGRQLCVQYGTAHIVAVPLEAAPNGAPAPAQFVNTGLPEFARCLAMAGRMWRLRYGLTPDQAGRWTVDFQQQLAALDPAALSHPENWWSVLVEQLWDGLL
ncbi:SUKH-4 family immunity protein [Streptomyces sp. WMMC897]|uniref:SUKH-4 family immunity protein n=1 Tax=Streptomyces sp. WMMC897 TaxID=3014782 RepID=UPI0022B60D36|nr:SUKH-4 family immunity protein [Streptomyces sp. WMMC897]MCZ7414712.1 SUKH-4 family immunity protein [Streptomyces sp. WMMC897]